MKYLDNKSIFVIIWILYVVFVSQFAFANNSQKVQFFEGNWEEVKATAKQEHKLIFVKAYAEWCWPCKFMEKTAFAYPQVAHYYNYNFINYKIDIESPEGIAFKEKYDIGSIPDLLYFDAKGKLVERVTGQQGIASLLQIGEKITGKAPKSLEEIETEIAQMAKEDVIQLVQNKKKSISKTAHQKARNNNLQSMQRQYESGFRKVTFLKDFAYLLKSNKLPYQEVVNAFIAKQNSRADFKKEDTQAFIYDFANDLNTKAIDILVKFKGDYAQKHGLEQVNEKIKNALFEGVNLAIERRDESLFKRVKKVATKAKVDSDNLLVYEIDAAYYKGINHVEMYAKAIRKYMHKYNGKSAEVWHNSAWNLVTSSENKSNLKMAKKWIEKSIYLNPQYYNYESYAYVLKMLGKKQQAIKVAKKAMKLGREGYKDILELHKLFQDDLPPLNPTDMQYSEDISTQL